MVDEATSNCLCEPTPPPVLPDTDGTGVQCCVDTDEYSAFLTKQFDNVATLERAFKEARKEASNTLDVLCEQLEKSQALEDENEQLKQRLYTLTTENGALLERTFELTDELASVRTLAASNRKIRGGGLLRFSVEKFLSYRAKKFRRGNLQCVTNFGYGKILCFRGLSRLFFESFLVSQYRKKP